jgi:hypothetical protein
MWAALIEKLGGKCELCPEDDPAKLEFDHKNGRDYDVSKLSSTARLARYAREAEKGEGRLLCGPCNLRERKRDDNGNCVPTIAVIEKTGEIPF